MLLDNCFPYRGKWLFVGHTVMHAKDRGGERLENGRLLRAAADAGIDLMVTIDKKIRNQQRLDTLPVSVLEVDTPDSRLPEPQRMSSLILVALPDCASYRFVSVDHAGNVERLSPRSA